MVIVITLPNHSKAQKKTDVIENSWASQIRVDAKLSDWGDTLLNVDKSTGLQYQIANDDRSIFIAVKALEQRDINKIMGGGLTVSINTEGKKRAGAFITFPAINQAVLAAMFRNIMRSQGQNQPPNTDAIRSKMIENAKEIYVNGFKEITEDTISIYNEYGIRAALNFDDKGHLIYEMAFPKSLYPILSDKDFLLSIKVNGITPPQMGAGGMGGFGGGGGDRQQVVIGGGAPGGGGRGGQQFNLAEISYLFTPAELWTNQRLAPSKKD